MSGTRPSTKTILILGASYGGARTAQVVAAGLKDLDAHSYPKGQKWRVVLVDRNQHANRTYARQSAPATSPNSPCVDLYIFSRISVLPGHEHKAFIPYTNVFALHPPRADGGTAYPPNAPHSFVHAQVAHIDLRAREVRLRRLSDDGAGSAANGTEETVAFDYLVYAMGSHLPAPIDMWGERIYKDSAVPAQTVEPRGVDLDAPALLHPEPEPEQPVIPNGNGRPPSPGARARKAALPVEVEALAEEEYRGLKAQAVARMRADQKRIAAAGSVLVVGGGALGIRACQLFSSLVGPCSV
jgi:apoptosis-inducing factor 2